MARRLRVGLLGNLCDNAVIFGELLCAEDLEISLYMSCQEIEESTMPALLYGEGLSLEERVRRLRRAEMRVFAWDHAPRLAFLRRLPLAAALLKGLLAARLAWSLRREEVLISFAMYHIPAWLSRVPYMAFCTGADLHEVAVERSAKGWLMRRALKQARLVRSTFDPRSRRHAVGLKLRLFRPFLIPWPIPPEPPLPQVVDGPIQVFMPSSQDWCNPQRWGIAKRNDLFIRAWAQRVGEGWDSHLTIVEKGPDLEATRNLVRELGVESRVRFIPVLDQQQLQEQIERADLVADQFDQGNPGALSLQALASGRALSLYWDEESSRLAYSCPPPVINGNTVEGLYQELKRFPGRGDLQELGRKGHAWMKREYDRTRLAAELRFHLSLAAGVELSLRGRQ